MVAENLEMDRDPFVIDLHYPSGTLHSPGRYSRSIVKIELSGRADDWPQESRPITPYVAEVLPQFENSQTLYVPCVLPTRTFLEKAALLHELHTRPGEQGLAIRHARHLYDLVRLWRYVKRDSELSNLFRDVTAHRRAYFNYSWVDYENLLCRDLQLTPKEDRLAEWRADYSQMRAMFFEEPPAFDIIIAAIKEIERSLQQL